MGVLTGWIDGDVIHFQVSWGVELVFLADVDWVGSERGGYTAAQVLRKESSGYAKHYCLCFCLGGENLSMVITVGCCLYCDYMATCVVRARFLPMTLTNPHLIIQFVPSTAN